MDETDIGGLLDNAMMEEDMVRRDWERPATRYVPSRSTTTVKLGTRALALHMCEGCRGKPVALLRARVYSEVHGAWRQVTYAQFFKPRGMTQKPEQSFINDDCSFDMCEMLYRSGLNHKLLVEIKGRVMYLC